MPCTAASTAIGGTAAAPICMTTCGRYASTACAMLPMRLTVAAPIRQEAPEVADGPAVVLRHDLCLGGHRAPLPAVRSYVTVCWPTSTVTEASTPSAADRRGAP